MLHLTHTCASSAGALVWDSNIWKIDQLPHEIVHEITHLALASPNYCKIRVANIWYDTSQFHYKRKSSADLHMILKFNVECFSQAGSMAVIDIPLPKKTSCNQIVILWLIYYYFCFGAWLKFWYCTYISGAKKKRYCSWIPFMFGCEAWIQFHLFKCHVYVGRNMSS